MIVISIWTVLALIGIGWSLVRWGEARQDLVAVIRADVSDERLLLARHYLQTTRLRTLGFTSWFVVGVLALLGRPGGPLPVRIMLLLGLVSFTASAWLETRAHRRLLAALADSGTDDETDEQQGSSR